MSGQTAKSSELDGLTYRRLRLSRPVMDHSPLMCSGFFMGLTAVAPYRRGPLVTDSCLSDFRLCQVSTITRLSRRCHLRQTGAFYVGRGQHDHGGFSVERMAAGGTRVQTLALGAHRPRSPSRWLLNGLWKPST